MHHSHGSGMKTSCNCYWNYWHFGSHNHLQKYCEFYRCLNYRPLWLTLNCPFWKFLQNLSPISLNKHSEPLKHLKLFINRSMLLVRRPCEEYVQSAELLLNFDRLYTILKSCVMVDSQRSMANFFPEWNSHTLLLAELFKLPSYHTFCYTSNTNKYNIKRIIKTD